LPDKNFRSISRDIWSVSGILKCLCIYSTSSRGKPTDVLRNLVGQHCLSVRRLHKHRPTLTKSAIPKLRVWLLYCAAEKRSFNRKNKKL
jgi:hypothetical protein